jgi:hypothetical protein
MPAIFVVAFNMRRKYLYVYLFTCSISCQSKSNTFKLDPVAGEVYSYSITKTSSQEFTYQNVANQIFDTVLLDIGLERMKSNGDTITTCKLTFNNLKIIPHPIKVSIIGNTKMEPYNLFAVLDSICDALHGLSVQVDITPDGNVATVHGMDELVTNISHNSKIDVNTVTRLLEDHVSVNAITDLLNRMLSIPRNQEVKVSDSWVEKIILITKAPIKLSNIYTVKNLTGDSVDIDIQSAVSTEREEGGNVYVKGKSTGEAILSYKTGMPYQYHTSMETITTTSYYDVVYKEHFTVKRTSQYPFP